jgi:hypothetical protein
LSAEVIFRRIKAQREQEKAALNAALNEARRAAEGVGPQDAEKAAKDAKKRADRAAREKAARIAAKAAREAAREAAQEKAAQEAKEKAAQEAQEKAAQMARKKAAYKAFREAQITARCAKDESEKADEKLQELRDILKLADPDHPSTKKLESLIDRTKKERKEAGERAKKAIENMARLSGRAARVIDVIPANYDELASETVSWSAIFEALLFKRKIVQPDHCAKLTEEQRLDLLRGCAFFRFSLEQINITFAVARKLAGIKTPSLSPEVDESTCSVCGERLVVCLSSNTDCFDTLTSG